MRSLLAAGFVLGFVVFVALCVLGFMFKALLFVFRFADEVKIAVGRAAKPAP